MCAFYNFYDCKLRVMAFNGYPFYQMIHFFLQKLFFSLSNSVFVSRRIILSSYQSESYFTEVHGEKNSI
jgi:hypothetical protein